MQDNFDIFDFELTAEEMNKIRAMNCGKRFFNMTLEEQEKTSAHGSHRIDSVAIKYKPCYNVTIVTYWHSRGSDGLLNKQD